MFVDQKRISIVWAKHHKRTDSQIATTGSMQKRPQVHAFRAGFSVGRAMLLALIFVTFGLSILCPAVASAEPLLPGTSFVNNRYELSGIATLAIPSVAALQGITQHVSPGSAVRSTLRFNTGPEFTASTSWTSWLTGLQNACSSFWQMLLDFLQSLLGLSPSPSPTVEITAEPMVVDYRPHYNHSDGYSQWGYEEHVIPAELKWSSTNASSAEINQNIGSVPLNGSRQVEPSATTTYVITVTGSGGTATDEVSVTVIYPAPPLDFRTDHDDIMVGTSTNLIWDTAFADTVTITPDIGTVTADGLITVSPEQSTIYTITAIGPGGTSTATVSINVQYLPPQVELTASPEVLQASGDESTLTWTTNGAESCILSPDIGSVAVNGSVLVAPTENTTYTIVATGPGGSASSSVDVIVSTANSITITSPANGDTITRADVMVTGEVSSFAGGEMGITVNGVVALVDGTDFTANHVPLEAGSNTITALVTDSAGNTIETSIIVQADPSDKFIELSTDTIAGIAPLEFTLSVDASFTLPATGASLTYTGPGTVEVLSSTQDSFNIRLTTPGIYYFTATVIDQGNTYTDVVAVQVLDKPALEQSLKAKWNAMKARLSVHDPTGAASYYALGSRNVYKQQFIALSAVLPQIVQEMGDITFVEYQYPRVLYDLRTVRNGQTWSFQLTFILDRDGIWRIWNY